jgi:protein subunit release factor B
MRKYFSIFPTIHNLTHFNTKFYFSTKINKDTPSISRSEIRKMISDKDNLSIKQTRSSGPGGQHVNKTSSAVLMKHLDTNLAVKVSDSRDSLVNYGKAKQRLVDKLDQHFNGSESKLAKKIEKVSKQKDKARRRSQQKHSNNKADNKS